MNYGGYYNFGDPYGLSDSRDLAEVRQIMEVGNRFENLFISRDSGEDSAAVVLEAGLWEALPEEIVYKILMWLPPAAQCRFRCVCSKWKALLSSSPGWFQHSRQENSTSFCTVMSGLGDEEDLFFCHTEHRWFGIPFNPPCSLDVPMQLVDVDGGLFCYQCYLNDGLWFVCNPITRSGRVLPTTDPPLEENASHFEMLKLLVDRETKSFNVVVLVYSIDPPTTLVFHSLTGQWSAFQSFPMRPLDLSCIFVFKNVIYVRCEEPSIMLAFAVDSGTWSEVKMEAPCDARTRIFMESKILIVSNDDRVLLVHLQPREKEPICVWKLLDDVPGIPIFSASRWQKLPMEFPTAMRILAGEFRVCISHGHECICFATCTTNQWMKYTFATKTWCKMPSRGDFVAERRWFGWEPGLDMDVGQGVLH